MAEYLTEYLIDAEKEVLLRADSRTCEFRDGTQRSITAFDVVWRWYDRLLRNVLSDNPYHILDLVEMEVDESDVSYDRALEIAVPNLVDSYMRLDFDVVSGDDDTLIKIRATQERKMAFHARNKGRGGDGGAA